MLPPEIEQAERQVDEPDRDEDDHAGDDRAADSPEADLPDRPRQHEAERAERDQLRDRAEREDDVLAAGVAPRPCEQMRREETTLVEARQMQRRDTRPEEEP